MSDWSKIWSYVLSYQIVMPQKYSEAVLQILKSFFEA